MSDMVENKDDQKDLLPVVPPEMTTVQNPEKEKEEEDNDDDEKNFIILTVVTPLDEEIGLGSVSLFENGGYIRQVLSEYYETCSYTCYDIVYKSASGPIIVNDYDELVNILPPNEENDQALPQEVTFNVVPTDYLEKTALLHVKRFRDIIAYPPNKVNIPAITVKEEEESPETNGDSTKTRKPLSDNELFEKKALASKRLPQEKTLLNERVSLENFYDSVLYSVGQKNDNREDIVFSESVMNVSYSGWNPPPLSRVTAGDLCYFEVRTASNSIIHITAISEGFYVNNCTLNNFDPSPAPNPHFSHEFVYTLCGACSPFHVQWTSLKTSLESDDQEAIEDSSPNALQNIAAAYRRDQSNNIFQVPQWHAQGQQFSMEGKNRLIGNRHKYDASRAQAVLSDSFGMELKGEPREWNEELQYIRDLPAPDTSQQAVKSKLIYRITTEFTAACRETVVAIWKGHIAPVNPMDDERSHVFIYNNIFFSRAIDTKDTFKVCKGDEACRKTASQDFKNQNLLQSLDIKGLSSVLCTIVDFMGVRMIGQSIVPGIVRPFNQKRGRLMYGALDDGNRLKCKSEGLTLMKKVGEKLSITERNILSTISINGNDGGSAASTASEKQSSSVLSSMEENEPHIQLDDEDEAFPNDSQVISHVGPLESKVLKGADDRLYLMDMIRVTPLDANFIEVGKGGTGNIEELNSVDSNVRMTYCLRQELLQEFMATQTVALRQNALQKLISDSAKNEEKEVENSPDEDCEEKREEVNENKKQPSPQFTDEDLARISKLECSYIFNPNCFLGDISTCKDSSEDLNILEKDEVVAREVAHFLWSKSLPNLNTMVRLGHVSVHDGKGLTSLMHSQGINMRYLGRLVDLANSAEASDKKLIEEDNMMKNPMPLYWLELLVIEILSRSMKHLVNKFLLAEKVVRSAPAKAVASFLNYLLSEASIVELEELECSKPSKDSKKKSKKKGDTLSLPLLSSSSLPETYKVPVNRNDFWDMLLGIAKSKFLFSRLLLEGLNLSPRISRVSLLRRVCQVCGIRVICKDYKFNEPVVFVATDILELFPIVKGGEFSIISQFSGFGFLKAAEAQLRNGNLAMAFDLAQDASKWISVVTGPAHKTMCQALEIISVVRARYGENVEALHTYSKKLVLEVQLYGFDSSQVLQGHIFLGALYHEVNNFEAAVAHLQSALFILRLIAGRSHPDVVNIYYRLALIYHDVGNHDQALAILSEAQRINEICGSLECSIPLYQTMSKISAVSNSYKAAIQLQKQSWAISKVLYGENDQRSQLAKTQLATLIRENAEYNEKQAQENADRERSDKVNRPSSLWLEDDEKKMKKKAGQKKKSGKKK